MTIIGLRSLPWLNGNSPSMIATTHDGVVAIVPTQETPVEVVSEESFVLRLDDNRADAPSPVTVRPAGVSAGRTVAIFGGSRTLRLRNFGDQFVLDELTSIDRWRELLPVPAHEGAAIVQVGLEDFVFVGGFELDADGMRQPVDSAFWAHVREGSIEQLPPLPQPRGAAHAYAIGVNQVMVAGGYTTTLTREEIPQSPMAEMLNASHTAWQPLEIPHRGWIGTHLTQLSNGDVLVAGGGDGLQSRAQSACVIWSAAHATWRPTGPLALGRSYGALVSLSDNRALLIGGSEFGIEWVSGACDNVSLFDSVSDTWTELAPLHSTRFSPLAALIGGSNVVAIVGGVDRTSRVVSDLEVRVIEPRT